MVASNLGPVGSLLRGGQPPPPPGRAGGRGGEKPAQGEPWGLVPKARHSQAIVCPCMNVCTLAGEPGAPSSSAAVTISGTAYGGLPESNCNAGGQRGAASARDIDHRHIVLNITQPLGKGSITLAAQCGRLVRASTYARTCTHERTEREREQPCRVSGGQVLRGT
jgi:hypothetical protein